ncbi:MAG: VWA domain-containing protein [Myxococcota bacterium]
MSPDPGQGVEEALAVPDAGVEPIELQLGSRLDNRFVAADAPSERWVRIGVRSPELEDVPRPAANIGIVVDTSGSMAGEAIDQARDAALTLLDDLHDGDSFSLVSFGSVAEVLVPATAVSPETKPAIVEAIEAMEASGTTSLSEGLAMGWYQVQLQAPKYEINRLVLVSDGVPNDEAAVNQTVAQVGVPITTLGLGLEFHETLLGRIAQTTGGRFHFVEEPEMVAAVFRDEVLGLERLAATGVSVTLNPGPGVSVLEVPGYGSTHQGMSQNGRGYVLRLPDLAEHEERTLLVKLGIGSHRDGATVELLDGVVNYTDARAGQGMVERTFVSAKATADEGALAEGVDLEVAVAAARATTAAATLQAVSMARSGQVPAAKTLVGSTIAQARALLEDMPDAELSRLVDGLVELEPTLEGLAPPPPPKVSHQRRPKKKSHPRPRPMTKGAPTAVSPRPQPFPNDGLEAQARSVRENHNQAYQLLHGN